MMAPVPLRPWLRGPELSRWAAPKVLYADTPGGRHTQDQVITGVRQQLRSSHTRQRRLVSGIRVTMSHTRVKLSRVAEEQQGGK
ncbi:PREDICTED: uncharacterized protein LOC106148795 isoform X2 [Chinchilla lanigera]|uniref:uncharacterized protein LOC106148795 isoform X2 n=1 Tax=Chinchilla lanigera TaxID=34839 RepID=UPI000695DADB|nr:PREDICTED: uncharacterized protein LOC106148795 isoform X2 [Chinchilla lanigera]